MNENILLTNHPLMDFILVHIFSIILFSENGITLKQNRILKDNKHKTNPVIGLYSKGIPIQKVSCNWKKYKKHQFPCFITTAYSATLLAKTANYIFNHPNIFKDSSLSPSIGSELANISSLQLDYCLENLENHHYSIETYAVFLEGCLAVMELKNKQPHLNTGQFPNLNGAVDIIYDRLSYDENLDLANTLELSRIASGVYSLLYEFPSHASAKELIGKISLELIHRRNSIGLFQRNRNNRRIAPLSWQFHCISSLLLAYSIYPIDKVLEETFSVFNLLYELSLDPVLNLFSFSRNTRVRYTPFEIAAIIKALYLLSSWVYGKEQVDKLNQILYNSYFPILLKDFFANYQQSLHVVYRRFMSIMNLPYESNTQVYKKIHKTYKAPIFPNSIQIIHSQSTLKTLQDTSKLQIQWASGSPLYIRYPLELCICLLDYLETYQQEEQNDDEDTNSSLLNLLFSILNQ